MRLGLSLGLTGGGQGAGAWVALGLDGSRALIDADFQGGRYWYNGQVYATETAWLAAIGGTKSGITRTIGPYVFGSELLTDGGFTSGVDSWALAPTYAGAGSLAQSAGELVVSFTSSTAIRARRPVTVTASRAFQATGTLVSSASLGSALFALSGDTDLNASENTAFTIASPPTTKSIVGASAGVTTYYVGAVAAYTSGASGNFHLDNVSVKEVYPYLGYSTAGLTALIQGVTPAVASGNKVVAQWGTDSERQRVRVVWDSTSHLRVIITSGNTEQANLDLGVVNASTAFTVRLGAADNNFYASLDGYMPTGDSAGTYPGLGKLWIARSFTGETWDGSVNRVTVFASRLNNAYLSDATKSFAVWGDSTAAGTGASTFALNWFWTLATGYTPRRAVDSFGVGGESSAQMLARVLANTDRRGWTTIFMDRPNTGETSAEYIANMKAAVAHLTTNRWFIMPPAQNVPDTALANITEVQALLLSDSFFAGHTLDSTSQAAYLTEVSDAGTRSDGLHFSDTGHAIQKTYIRAFLDAQGW